jgi:hypothetical protein
MDGRTDNKRKCAGASRRAGARSLGRSPGSGCTSASGHNGTALSHAKSKKEGCARSCPLALAALILLSICTSLAEQLLRRLAHISTSIMCGATNQPSFHPTMTSALKHACEHCESAWYGTRSPL